MVAAPASSFAPDVTDAAAEPPAESPGAAAGQASLWTSHTCLGAIDGAVAGNTLGFIVGAFPGMCIGAASGGVAGVLGGGLLEPALRPALDMAASAGPGSIVLSAGGAAQSFFCKLCLGPRPSERGRAGDGPGAAEETTQDNADCEEAEGGPQEPLTLAGYKKALDLAMVRASAAGAQGATAGAEMGGAIVGTAVSIPGAVVGTVVGCVVGMYGDVWERYSPKEESVPVAESRPLMMAGKAAPKFEAALKPANSPREQADNETEMHQEPFQVPEPVDINADSHKCVEDTGRERQAQKRLDIHMDSNECVEAPAPRAPAPGPELSARPEAPRAAKAPVFSGAAAPLPPLPKAGNPFPEDED